MTTTILDINNLLLPIGGITGVTLIYFLVVIYYYRKQIRNQQTIIRRIEKQNRLLIRICTKLGIGVPEEDDDNED